MAAVHTREKLSVRSSGGPAGAYVTGIDLSRVLDAEEAAALKQALADHLVVALPDQKISLDDLEALTDALGGRDVTPFVKPLPDRPYVIRILKEPAGQTEFCQCVAHRSFLSASASELHAALLSSIPAHWRRHDLGQSISGASKPCRRTCAIR